MRYLLLAGVMLSGCSAKTVLVKEPEHPDTTGVLALMGKTAIAHACAIGPREALTAAHVMEPRPLEPSVPLVGSRWSAGTLSGRAVPGYVWAEVDIVTLSSLDAFPKYYERVDSAPEPGETLWLVQYSWESADKAFADKVLEVTVKRVVAGHVIFDPSGEGGSSGSCLLNKVGKLVGINIAGKGVGFNEEVGIAVGLWGDWYYRKPEPEFVIEEIRF
jgi:hypothetical protein